MSKSAYFPFLRVTMTERTSDKSRWQWLSAVFSCHWRQGRIKGHTS